MKGVNQASNDINKDTGKKGDKDKEHKKNKKIIILTDDSQNSQDTKNRG